MAPRYPKKISDALYLLNDARLDLDKAKKNIQAATKELKKALEVNPPVTCRLQEAYEEKGKYDPHMDEIVCCKTQTTIPQDELYDHLMNPGQWTCIGHDEGFRELYRRVIDIEWNDDNHPMGQS